MTWRERLHEQSSTDYHQAYYHGGVPFPNRRVYDVTKIPNSPAMKRYVSNIVNLKTLKMTKLTVACKFEKSMQLNQ